jgi:hypothetical protein
MLQLAFVAVCSGSPVPQYVPDHVTIMTAYGYDAAAQANWSSFGKSFNLSQLVEGYSSYGLRGMYRIDCVGCEHLRKHNPQAGYAAGVICHNSSAKVESMCYSFMYYMRMACSLTGCALPLCMGTPLTGTSKPRSY